MQPIITQPRHKALRPPASVDAPADSMAQIEAR